MSSTWISKHYHLLLVLLIAIGGFADAQTISALPECQRLRLFYCRCEASQTAQLTPVHMCVYTTKTKDTCHPCPIRLQQYVNCSSCPANSCAVCSTEKFGKTTYGSPEQLFFSFSEKSGDLYYQPAKDVFRTDPKSVDDASTEADVFSYDGVKRMLRNSEGRQSSNPSKPVDVERKKDTFLAGNTNQKPGGRLLTSRRRRDVPRKSFREDLTGEDVLSKGDGLEILEDEAIPVSGLEGPPGGGSSTKSNGSLNQKLREKDVSDRDADGERDATDSELENSEGSKNASELENSENSKKASGLENSENSKKASGLENSEHSKKASGLENSENSKKASGLENSEHSKKASELDEKNSMAISNANATQNSRKRQARYKRQVYPIKVLIVESEAAETKRRDLDGRKKSNAKDGTEGQSSKNAANKRKNLNSFVIKQKLNTVRAATAGIDHPLRNNENKCYTFRLGSYTSQKAKNVTYHFLCKISEADFNKNIESSETALEGYDLMKADMKLGDKQLHSLSIDLINCFEKSKRFRVVPNELRIDVSDCPLTFLSDYVLEAIRRQSLEGTQNYKHVSRNISTRHALTKNVELDIAGQMNYTVIHSSRSAITRINIVSGDLMLMMSLRSNLEKQLQDKTRKILMTASNAAMKDQYPWRNEPRPKLFVWYFPRFPSTPPLLPNRQPWILLNNQHTFPSRLDLMNHRAFDETGMAPLTAFRSNDGLLTSYRNEMAKIKFYKMKPGEHHAADMLEPKNKGHASEMTEEAQRNSLDRRLKNHDSPRLPEIKTRRLALLDVFANLNNGLPVFNDWVAIDGVDNTRQARKTPAGANVSRKERPSSLIDLFSDVDMNASRSKIGNGKTRIVLLSVMSIRKRVINATEDGIKLDTQSTDKGLQKQKKHSEDGISKANKNSHDIGVTDDDLFEVVKLGAPEYHSGKIDGDNPSRTGVMGGALYGAVSTRSPGENDAAKGSKVEIQNGGTGLKEENESENEILHGTKFLTRRLLHVSNEGKGTKEEFGVRHYAFNKWGKAIRRRKRTLPHNSWCYIPRAQRHGTLDCTLWTFKKECSLSCHPGWSSHQGVIYRCNRKENKWTPALETCQPGKDLSDKYPPNVLQGGNEAPDGAQAAKEDEDYPGPESNDVHGPGVDDDKYSEDDGLYDEDDDYDVDDDGYDDDESPPKHSKAQNSKHEGHYYEDED